MKHVELEQFWHALTSRGFDSVSWAFLFMKGKMGYQKPQLAMEAADSV